jgi:hypothetical protein
MTKKKDKMKVPSVPVTKANKDHVQSKSEEEKKKVEEPAEPEYIQ